MIKKRKHQVIDVDLNLKELQCVTKAGDGNSATWKNISDERFWLSSEGFSHRSTLGGKSSSHRRRVTDKRGNRVFLCCFWSLVSSETLKSLKFEKGLYHLKIQWCQIDSFNSKLTKVQDQEAGRTSSQEDSQPEIQANPNPMLLYTMFLITTRLFSSSSRLKASVPPNMDQRWETTPLKLSFFPLAATRGSESETKGRTLVGWSREDTGLLFIADLEGVQISSSLSRLSD